MLTAFVLPKIQIEKVFSDKQANFSAWYVLLRGDNDNFVSGRAYTAPQWTEWNWATEKQGHI